MMLADRLSGWNGRWPGMSCAIAALCCTFMAGQKTSHGAWVEWKRGNGNTCRGETVDNHETQLAIYCIFMFYLLSFSPDD